MEVDCPYCGRVARLVDSKAIYRESHGMVWLCDPCRAWVGVHKNDGKNRPLGTLANSETRVARRMAHERFDPLWRARLSKSRPKYKVRGEAYTWLAERLGIPVDDCHIALFDLKTCVRVVEICVLEPYNGGKAA